MNHYLIESAIQLLLSTLFPGVTCHWVLQDGSRKKSALACRRMIGRHTFDKIAKELVGVMHSFSIQNKTTGCTTDGGSNFEKSFNLFSIDNTEEIDNNNDQVQANDEEEEDNDDLPAIELTPILDSSVSLELPSHFRCGSHKLNNVATTEIKSAYGDRDFKRVSRAALAKAQALFNKQSKSNLACDYIRQHCAGKLFILPNATRWNSQFDAIQWLTEVLLTSHDSSNGLMDDVGLPRFTETDIKFFEEYVRVYHHFSRALDQLQGEKNTYLGILLPVLTSALKKLSEEREKVDICKPLADALIDGIKKKFAVEFACDRYYIASAVHPRVKLNWLNDPLKESHIWDLIQNEIQDMQRRSNLTQPDTGNRQSETR